MVSFVTLQGREQWSLMEDHGKKFLENVSNSNLLTLVPKKTSWFLVDRSRRFLILLFQISVKCQGRLFNIVADLLHRRFFDLFKIQSFCEFFIRKNNSIYYCWLHLHWCRLPRLAAATPLHLSWDWVAELFVLSRSLVA